MKKMMLAAAICVAVKTWGQDSSHAFRISGYADLYYQYADDQRRRPFFLYNYVRNHRLRSNLLLLNASYTRKKWELHLGGMAGDYPAANLAAEPKPWKNIYEARVTYRWKQRWSLDAGIFSSHIGMESCVGKDNWNLSRSILAENSPYYETGVKLNYEDRGGWTYSLLLINGWQHIRDNNQRPAIGTQVQGNISPKLKLNSSLFIGDEGTGPEKKWRIFHNFYSVYQPHASLSLAFLFDAGAQKAGTGSDYDIWYGTALLAQYKIASHWNLAGRWEYFRDPQNLILTEKDPGRTSVGGMAFGLDYAPCKGLLIRSEYRHLNSETGRSSLLHSIAVFF